jgi:hypothetical protein
MTELRLLNVHNVLKGTKTMFLAVIFARGVSVMPLDAQNAATAAKPTPVGASTHFQPNWTPRRKAAYFGLVWGVDSFYVKAVESGELIRFGSRVLDADEARKLNNKDVEAFLISPAAHVRLVVPSLEKVGQLRQVGTPEVGRSYWMAFSNPGRPAMRGDRVDVVIGPFHAEGLIVE